MPRHYLGHTLIKTILGRDTVYITNGSWSTEVAFRPTGNGETGTMLVKTPRIRFQTWIPQRNQKRDRVRHVTTENKRRWTKKLTSLCVLTYSQSSLHIFTSKEKHSKYTTISSQSHKTKQTRNQCRRKRIGSRTKTCPTNTEGRIHTRAIKGLILSTIRTYHRINNISVRFWPKWVSHTKIVPRWSPPEGGTAITPRTRHLTIAQTNYRRTPRWISLVSNMHTEFYWLFMAINLTHNAKNRRTCVRSRGLRFTRQHKLKLFPHWNHCMTSLWKSLNHFPKPKTITFTSWSSLIDTPSWHARYLFKE